MFKEDGNLPVGGIEADQQSQVTYYGTEDGRPLVEPINKEATVQMSEHRSMRDRIPNWTLIKVLLIVVTAMQERSQAPDIQGEILSFGIINPLVNQNSSI